MFLTKRVFFLIFYFIFLWKLTGDTVILKNGRIIEGKIFNQTREKVFIRLNNGKEEIIDKNQIAKITFESLKQKRLEEERKRQEELRKIEEQKRLEEERKRQEELRKIEERKRLEAIKQRKENYKFKFLNAGIFVSISSVSQVNYLLYDTHLNLYNYYFLSFFTINIPYIFTTKKKQQNMISKSLKTSLESKKLIFSLRFNDSDEIHHPVKYNLISDGLYLNTDHRSSPFRWTNINFTTSIGLPVDNLFLDLNIFNSRTRNIIYEQLQDRNSESLIFNSELDTFEKGTGIGISFEKKINRHIVSFRILPKTGESDQSSKSKVSIINLSNNLFLVSSYSVFSGKSRFQGGETSLGYLFLIDKNIYFNFWITSLKKNYKYKSFSFNGFTKPQNLLTNFPLLTPPLVILFPNLLNQEYREFRLSMGISKSWNL